MRALPSDLQPRVPGRRRGITIGLTALACTLVACTGGDSNDGPLGDASPDAMLTDASAEDAATPPIDGDTADAGGQDAAAEDAATDAPVDARLDASGRCDGPPGLYVEGQCEEVNPGVRRFVPRFALWSDGAEKERFFFIPAGTTIDASDPGAWVFPIGTRLYKTFIVDGVRLETRLLEKTSARAGPVNWEYRVFLWNRAQDAVVETTLGADNVLGTLHDVPAREDCIQCHAGGAVDVALGFSAMQLNHTLAEVPLRDLLREELLDPRFERDLAQFPGDIFAQEALGYMHANCGGCHGGDFPEGGLTLWIPPGAATVEETEAYLSTVGVDGFWVDVGTIARIDPGNPDGSSIVQRMSRRDSEQMPPIATERTHPSGITAVTRWIEML